MLQKILRRREVEALTGKRKSGLYADIALGKFPKPIRLGQRSVGWLASDIESWQAARIAERDAETATFVKRSK